MGLLFQAKLISWGSEHLMWLLAGVSSMLFWINLGLRQRHEAGQRRIGLVMGLIPVVIWAGVSVYLVFSEAPQDLNIILPFHVCYFLNLLMPIMLWRRSYALFELSYFMVIAGCLQALLTPDVHIGFPHYMNVRYFIVHIGLVQSILYAIVVYRFRPEWKSLWKSLAWTNVYLVFVALVNWTLGTNFMYLCAKPNSTTMLDLFGDWPWYIIGGEFLALALYMVVFTPFMLGNRELTRQAE